MASLQARDRESVRLAFAREALREARGSMVVELCVSVGGLHFCFLLAGAFEGREQ